MAEYSQAHYDADKAVIATADAYWKANATHGKHGSSMSAELAAHPQYADCDNAMRSRVERFEIFRDKPEKIFAYLSSDCKNVTTWTGDHLGTVAMISVHKSNFGDKRYYFQSVIAGKRYSGIGFGGGGMYCRLKVMKGI